PLGLDFVAFSYGYKAHVVTKACDSSALRVIPGCCWACPDVDLVAHRRVFPVADHDLPRQPQPRADKSELAVAVRRLIQIHKVHIDLVPGNVAVILRMQMEERLMQES